MVVTVWLLAAFELIWLLVRLDPGFVTGAASSVGLDAASPSCTDTKAAATPTSDAAAITGVLSLVADFLGLA
ncbi:MAG TPA: hypothetical protein VH480_01195 [Streptosporangiaceae bacterium]|jgi:hypothetical protein